MNELCAGDDNDNSLPTFFKVILENSQNSIKLVLEKIISDIN